MAINPNVDFTSGSSALYTQMNRFPRGVVAYGSATSNTGNLTAETVTITAVTFTAVASRYYQVTYFEPWAIYVSGTCTGSFLRVRNGTTTGGTELNRVFLRSNSGDHGGSVLYVGTFSAGSVNIVATAGPQGSATPTVNYSRSSTTPAFLLVQDIGPA